MGGSQLSIYCKSCIKPPVGAYLFQTLLKGAGAYLRGGLN